jgi:hypothetical protein
MELSHPNELINLLNRDYNQETNSEKIVTNISFLHIKEFLSFIECNRISFIKTNTLLNFTFKLKQKS